MTLADGSVKTVTGCSIGGGKVLITELDGFPVEIEGIYFNICHRLKGLHKFYFQYRLHCGDFKQRLFRQIAMGLMTCAGFGIVIANRASVSGAVGGCQAECGAASAMAAAAAVELRGGTPEQAGQSYGAVVILQRLAVILQAVIINIRPIKICLGLLPVQCNGFAEPFQHIPR